MKFRLERSMANIYEVIDTTPTVQFCSIRILMRLFGVRIGLMTRSHCAIYMIILNTTLLSNNNISRFSDKIG